MTDPKVGVERKIRKIGSGSAKLSSKIDGIRKKHRNIRRDAMAPRDRHVDTNRLRTAIARMSQDLDSCENFVEKLTDELEDLKSKLESYEKHILTDLKKLESLVNKEKIFSSYARIRAAADPYGADTFQTLLPGWIPDGGEK